MKISMSRDVTNKVHWMLDNILPPIVRESKILMGILAFVIYGKYGKYYLNFKDKCRYLKMSEEEFKHCYEMIEPIITRPTDINSRCMQLLLDKNKNWGGKRILDISCGRGYLVQKLAANNPDITIVGCDINIPDYLKDSDDGRISYREENIEHLSFEDSSFDIVISAHTLEHVVNAKQAYNELKRVCREKLIIMVPCQRPYRYTMDFHVQFFPYDFSLYQFTGNYSAKCKKIDNDWFYEEMISKG